MRSGAPGKQVSRVLLVFTTDATIVHQQPKWTWDQPGATLAQIAACAALTGAVPADKEGRGAC